MTFAEADQASRRFAKQLLAAGVGKGTRVGFMFPNGTDWVVGWLGVTRIGALFMPFSSTYKPAELRKGPRGGGRDPRAARRPRRRTAPDRPPGRSASPG